MRSVRIRFLVASTLAGALSAAGLWACSAAPDGDVTELDDALSQPGQFTSNLPADDQSDDGQSADAGAPPGE